SACNLPRCNPPLHDLRALSRNAKIFPETRHAFSCGERKFRGRRPASGNDHAPGEDLPGKNATAAKPAPSYGADSPRTPEVTLAHATAFTPLFRKCQPQLETASASASQLVKSTSTKPSRSLLSACTLEAKNVY